MAASLLRDAKIWGPYVVRCLSSKGIGGTRQCVCRLQQQKLQDTALRLVRTASVAATASATVPPPPPSSATATVAGDRIAKVPQIQVSDPADLYRERYIPITRRSIIRFLMEEENGLSVDEKKQFEDFALALDSAIVNKYHGILHELKLLFDPINPDKDTAPGRQFSRRERLDNEFWLLQRLEDIMDKANFTELERPQVLKILQEHDSSEGVRVSVNPDRYDVLRFWVLGRERPEPEPTLLQQLLNKALKRPAKPQAEFYKRVVVAIRLKKDSKLLLKLFKEIPVNSLEMLLPDGTLRMNKMDRGLVSASVFLASAGLLAKAVTLLAAMNLDWMLLVTLVTGGVGIQAWNSYKNRRNAYLVSVSRTLYFKNLANNHGLLAHLVDRAEDESFKEALLAFTFLLTHNRKAMVKAAKGPAKLGGLPDAALETKVEQWIEAKTGVRLEFDSSEAVLLLKHFGILSQTDEKLHVLPLDSALRCLPITPQSLIARSAEADIKEGYDRDEYLETEHEYKEEERRARRYGWF